MRIGTYNVELIETGRFMLDGGAMFGVVPKPLWQRAYPHVDEKNRITMGAHALLIRGEGITAVVDSGCGLKLSEKLQSIYAVDNSRFSLSSELERRRIAPEDVTHFIYTHLHFDHAGGSTYLNQAGEAVPTFPNARHYVQKDHLAWARKPTEKDQASFFPENWEPVVEHGLMEELDGNGFVLPGVEVRTVHGHTRAMQMVIVHGEDEKGESTGLVYCADLIPTRAHVPYPYIMGYDNEPLKTLEEKKALLPEAYERRWILCFEHDAYAPAAVIEPSGKGFVPTDEIDID